MNTAPSRRELWGWLGIVCLFAFAIGYVISQHLKQPGPMEFHPDRTSPVASSHEKAPLPLPLRGQPTPPASGSSPSVDQTPSRATETGPRKQSNKSKPLPEPRSISINDATLNELERLPGVGPVMAQMIVDYRTQVGRFGSVEDLMNVKGLGPKKYEKMAPYVRL